MKRLILLLALVSPVFGQLPGDTLGSRLALRDAISTRWKAAHEDSIEDRSFLDSTRFRNGDGSFTELFAHGLNWTDPDDGLIKPVEPTLYTTNRGWLVLGSPVKTRLASNIVPANTYDLGLYWRDAAATWRVFTLVISTPTYLSGLEFTFMNDTPWTLDIGNGYELTSTIAAAQGAHAYSWTRTAASLAPTVDADGNLTGDGSFRMTRAVMVRADGITTPCSAWSTQNRTLRFTCDDTGFPAGAFPYVIDPTTSYYPGASADDGYLLGSGGSWPPAYGSTNTSATSLHVRADAEAVYTAANAMAQFNTTVLPTDATITSATLNIYVASNTNTDSLGLCIGPYATSNWPVSGGDYNVGCYDSTFYQGAFPSTGAQALTVSTLTGITKGAYTGVIFTLDTSGIEFGPTGVNTLQFRSFDYTGNTSLYLSVTYTLPVARRPVTIF